MKSKKFIIQIMPEDGGEVKTFFITKFRFYFFISLILLIFSLFIFSTFFYGTFFYLYNRYMNLKVENLELKENLEELYILKKNIIKIKNIERKLRKILNISTTKKIDIKSLLNGNDQDFFADLESSKLLYNKIPNILPLQGWISADFIEGKHLGIDITAKEGTPFYATADGIVVSVGYSDYFGKYIVIQHDYGFKTKYAHCDKIFVKEGEKVKKGQIIGLVGKTGVTTGSHLHYEILKDNKNISPLDFIKSTKKMKGEG